jgi:hypothetical protein
LYESRFITKRRFPNWFQKIPYVVYISATLSYIYFVYSQTQHTYEQLDAKYTPIWLRIITEGINGEDA